MKKLFTLVLVLFTMSEIMYATSSNNYLLDSIVRVDESTGFVDSKKIYEFHANGTKSRYTAFNARWSSWKVGRPKILNNKSTFVYDEDGNELDYFSSVLDTTTWIWKDTHYYLYDERHNRVCGVRKWNEDSTVVLQGSHYYYDEDNFQIGSDQFDTWNGVQVLDYKCENTKDAHGNKIIMVEYSKPESAWEGDYMSDPNAFNEAAWVRIDSVYYTYNEKQEKMQETIYRWDNENQEWKLDGYQIFEYDADGHCIADTVFARDFETNVITYNNMTAYIYDSHGQLSRIQMFMPNFTEDGVEWLENGMYAYDYTYDENGEILQLRDYIDWQNNTSSITYYTSTYYYSEHPVKDDPEPSVHTTEGAIKGVFSVAEGRQVVFSKGNLQYNAAQGTHACADGTTQPGTWRFAEEQYDARLSENLNRSATYNGWIDLFSYGASGYNGITPYSGPKDAASLGQIGNVKGTNYDYGIYNAISNGGCTPGFWRMFTQNEWEYLIKTRPYASKLCKIIRINGIYGVVILPDNADTTLLEESTDVPSYTISSWHQLEAKGAVFLPAGGGGEIINGNLNIFSTNESGYYVVPYLFNGFTTTIELVGFNTIIFSAIRTSTSLFSVRLVKDVDIYHLNAIPNHSTWGTISGDSLYFGEDISVTATPNYGYHFVQWSDGITDNPRAFTLTADSTITAEFAPNTFTLNVSCDAEQGTINGESGAFAYLSEHTFEAVANHGFTFKAWSDGITDNPRTIVLTSDSTITAIYDINYYPVVLLDHNGKLLSKQTVAYKHAAQQPEVPAREGYTFSGWSTDIESILDSTYAIAIYDKIGGTLTYLSEEGDVIATENVDLHLPAAPIIAGKSFKGWLTESADAENGIVLRATYTSDNPNTHDDVTITPSSNSAYVIFPFITGALTYQLVIRDLFGNVVCKIMFSATGHLLGIAFAPSRNRESQQATQTTGFNFTVEGLDANTTYEYEFVANDDTDEVIETLSGSFTTTAEVPTDNEQVNSSSAVRKYLEDGHLMIDANSHIFDTQGKMIK